mgnify:CR=1 FL=1
MADLISTASSGDSPALPLVPPPTDPAGPAATTPQKTPSSPKRSINRRAVGLGLAVLFVLAAAFFAPDFYTPSFPQLSSAHRKLIYSDLHSALAAAGSGIKCHRDLEPHSMHSICVARLPRSHSTLAFHNPFSVEYDRDRASLGFYATLEGDTRHRYIKLDGANAQLVGNRI